MPAIVAASGAAVTPWESIHNEVGVVERGGPIYDRRGTLLGRVEFIHSVSQSLNAICANTSHTEELKAICKKGVCKGCYLLAASNTRLWERYKMAVEWLLEGPDVTTAAHQASQEAVCKRCRDHR